MPRNFVRNVEAFRQGLRELGYVEGKNINIEYRYAEGRLERLPELAEELVRLRVDIFVEPSNCSPIGQEIDRNYSHRLASVGDPVEGLVASLARPGGNVTGLTTIPRS